MLIVLAAANLDNSQALIGEEFNFFGVLDVCFFTSCAWLLVSVVTPCVQLFILCDAHDMSHTTVDLFNSLLDLLNLGGHPGVFRLQTESFASTWVYFIIICIEKRDSVSGENRVYAPVLHISHADETERIFLFSIKSTPS